MLSDEDLFRAYKIRPEAGTLQDLLRTLHGRIYNVCFQVLRHAQDAEDATQEAMLDLLEGMRDLPDAPSLRRWTYRVSLNTALTLRTRRRRRQERECKEGLMEKPQSSPRSTEARELLFQAIARLRDHGRELIIRHYFEKATLKELAREQGCSEGAIWKRIEQAKGRLRQGLSGASLGAFAAAWEKDLAALVPVASSAPAMSAAVVAKAAAIASRDAVAGAAITLGGTAMGGAKTGLSIAAILLALAFVGIGFGGGRLIRSRMGGGGSDGPGARLAAAQRQQGGRRGPNPASPAARVADGTAREAASTGGPPLTLADRLVQFRDWLLESWERERAEFRAEDRKSPSSRARYLALEKELYRRMNEAVEALRPLVLADPETYFAFLKDPKSEHPLVLTFFVTSLLLDYEYRSEPSGGGSASARNPLRMDDFPAKLKEGLDDLLRTGSPEQKVGVLRVHRGLKDVPPEYQGVYRSLLREPGATEAHAAALDLLEDRSLREVFPTVRTIVESCENSRTLGFLYRGMDRMKFAEAEEFLIHRLANHPDPRATGSLANTLGRRIGEASPALQHSYVEALSAAIRRTNYDAHCFQAILGAVLHLPPAKALPLLEEAAPRAPEPALSRTVAGMAERLRRGVTDVNALRSMLYRQQDEGW